MTENKLQVIAQDNLKQVKSLLSNINVKKRFEEILGQKAPGFMASIINAINANPELRKCEPNSVVSSAIVAATLDLPIDQNLGFAYIIPYKVQGIYKAQFQIGYRGFIQLAIRSGVYKTINAAEVYEGEIKSVNRFTGEIEFELNAQKTNKIVGYVAYFKLLNGFEKYYYMTIDEIKKHAQKYSKTYNSKNGSWQNEFHAMALKTVIKMLLKKYGVLSVDMQTAIMADQAVINQKNGKFEYEYVDNMSYEKDEIFNNKDIELNNEEIIEEEEIEDIESIESNENELKELKEEVKDK
ncbi:MAG: recombinase RecT [Thermovenabulum sp.]|uniref:recombinase RecT n=1 Tax=Thermovenabulum sp. TaxID=3100335 RepID=UPI003C7A423D